MSIHYKHTNKLFLDAISSKNTFIIEYQILKIVCTQISVDIPARKPITNDLCGFL